jgi:agmatinase
MKCKLNDDWVKTHPASLEILNVKHARRLELSKEAFQLLKRFQSLISLQAIIDDIASSKAESDALESFLETLIELELLIPEAEGEPFPQKSITEVPDLVTISGRSFLNCPTATLETCQADLAFFGAPFDFGCTGFPGSRFAPDKLRQFSSELFPYYIDLIEEKCLGWQTYDRKCLAGFTLADLGDIAFRIGEPLHLFHERTQRTVADLVQSGVLPLMIGGDHGCTLATLRALKQHYGTIGLIQFDAHSDLAEWDTDLEHHHGNFLTRAKEENLLSHLIQVGVRDWACQPSTSADHHVFPIRTLQNQLDELQRCINPEISYFLSLDIDVIDPAFAPGTGTPEPGGLTPNQMLALLDLVQQRARLIGADLMEINPMKDQGDMTLHLASHLLINLAHTLVHTANLELNLQTAVRENASP